MSERPASLCHLKTGAPVAPQENFAATFNWLVSFCENLRGENGVVVDKTVSDRPVVKAEASDDAEDGDGAATVGGETLTVVTGLSFGFDGSGRLVATASTKTVTLPAGSSVADGGDVAVPLPLWSQRLVAASVYDEEGRKFTNTMVEAVRAQESDGGETVEVFEAVQHDPEEA